MDASLLSVTYSTPWHIALIDELVDHLHQVTRLLFLILCRALTRYD